MFGDWRYQLAARQAAESVLAHSDFDIFLAHDQEKPFTLSSSRCQSVAIPDEMVEHFPARLFLKKFRALRACLDAGRHPLVLCLDADAIMAARVDRRMIEQALDGHAVGMVEQTGIRGGSVGRPELLAHYQNYTLNWFEPGRRPAVTSPFRYYNSGVVLARREKLREIVEWVENRLARSPGDHKVGHHMISDQDYYQYWVHAVDPGCCAALPWRWNHCRHWDEGFPLAEALILHFSFFCKPPALRQIAQMALLRRGLRRLSRAVELAGGAM
jgi:hypothetical protein